MCIQYQASHSRDVKKNDRRKGATNDEDGREKERQGRMRMRTKTRGSRAVVFFWFGRSCFHSLVSMEREWKLETKVQAQLKGAELKCTGIKGCGRV